MRPPLPFDSDFRAEGIGHPNLTGSGMAGWPKCLIGSGGFEGRTNVRHGNVDPFRIAGIDEIAKA